MRSHLDSSINIDILFNNTYTYYYYANKTLPNKKKTIIDYLQKKKRRNENEFDSLCMNIFIMGH